MYTWIGGELREAAQQTVSVSHVHVDWWNFTNLELAQMECFPCTRRLVVQYDLGESLTKVFPMYTWIGDFLTASNYKGFAREY